MFATNQKKKKSTIVNLWQHHSTIEIIDLKEVCLAFGKSFPIIIFMKSLLAVHHMFGSLLYFYQALWIKICI